MKSFKQFMSESVTISGNASVGTIIIGGSSEDSGKIGESFVADILWKGNIHRLQLESDYIPTKRDLSEKLQSQYPGAVVHNIYPTEQDTVKVIQSKRYHPAKLEWI